MNKIKKSILIMLSMLMVCGVVATNTKSAKAVEPTIVENPEGLELAKKSEAVGNGDYKITLDSYTTGDIKTEEKSQPIDFIFVMDQSGSMGVNYGASTRKDALVKSAQTFLSKVKKNADDNDVDHRIATVGFSEQNYGTGILGDTKLNTIGREIPKVYPMDYKNDSDFEGKLLDVRTSYATLGKNISSLEILGATYPQYGFDIAKRIFDNDKIEASRRKRVIVFFTDGEPSGAYSENPSSPSDALVSAYDLKNKYDATIFSIGATADITSVEALGIKKFLDYASSNYPLAKSIVRGPNYTEGWVRESNEYSLLATDDVSLENVFDKIYDQIMKPSIDLNQKTTVKDVMSDYFQNPDIRNIQVFTMDYNGIDPVTKELQWTNKQATSLIVDITGNTVNVSGFNYTENFVGTDSSTNQHHGKKVVIEIMTRKVDGFIGGNQVPTNDKTSGIYVENKIIGKFEEPTVSVPIDFQGSVNSAGIYIGSNMDRLEDLFDMDITKDGIQFKNNKDQIYTIDGINNKFVEIKQEVKIDGVVVATYTIGAGQKTGTWDNDLDFSSLVDNKSVDINTIITPTVVGNIASQQGISQSAIYVYKPVLTVEDQVIFLGEKVNLDDSVKKVEWINKNAHAVKPTGDAPTLSYDYVSKNGTLVRDSNDNYSLIEDTDLTMVVKNGNKVITDHTTINNAAQHQDIDLKVQVVKGELTITKTIDAQYTHNDTLKANQTFVFKIDVRNEKDGDIIDSYYQTISFSANEGLTNKSITIKGLQKGYYTVTEVSDWSWKYTENVLGRKDNYIGNGTFSGLSENANILIGDRDIINAGESNVFFGCQSGTVINGKEQNSVATVSFINNIKDTNILGDNASAINKFKGN